MFQNELLRKSNKIGQSIWYDNLSRELLNNGELKSIIEIGITGLTSNPSIFEKAISNSELYDEDIKSLSKRNLSDIDIYENIAIADIKSAADLLHDVFVNTNGNDGFVSIEVNPHLAHDYEQTVIEARRLVNNIDRPNIMIKIPATNVGVKALETLIGEGISVNVTLIFSLDRYASVMESYIRGLKLLYESGRDVSKVFSVASFFISRVDVAVDAILNLQQPDNTASLGVSAISNAKMAYKAFQIAFNDNRFVDLKKKGAKLQKPLWASTSTKNPQFPDLMYVQELMGPNSINTLPDATLKLFIDHGIVDDVISDNYETAFEHISTLIYIGINLDEITDKLLSEGLLMFQESFDLLLLNISQKRLSLA